MPDAHQYREAAAQLGLLAALLADEAAGIDVTGAPDRIATGPVREVVAHALVAGRRHLASAADEVARLALVCRRRAEICDDVARTAARYEHLDADARRRARPPVRPAWWVER